MASKITLTPDMLLDQGTEMETLTSSFEELFQNITDTLQNTNDNWSENLAHNFAGKITSAQQGFSAITALLSSGAQAAKASATTFTSIDSSLTKAISGNEVAAQSTGIVGNAAATASKSKDIWGDKNDDYIAVAHELESGDLRNITNPENIDKSLDVWHDIAEKYRNLPEGAKKVLEDQFPEETKIIGKIDKIEAVVDDARKNGFDYKKDGSKVVSIFDKSDGKMLTETYDVTYSGKARGTQIMRDAEDAIEPEITRYWNSGEYGKAAGSMGKLLMIEAYGEAYNVFDVGTNMVGNIVEGSVSTVGNRFNALGNLLGKDNAIGKTSKAIGSAINWFGKKSSEGWHSMF